ncbi:MAG TPA: DNA topoisomerase IB [Rhodocyclaceae bacterium]|nr:DNA topoisomerase IB [Rhodocyclaceae bacterium]
MSDSLPGIRREPSRDGFEYFSVDGRKIVDALEIKRIDALAIPPAYTDVWICADPCGHLQATGRDARRRKQYRYHPQWRAIRDVNKYDRMLAFGSALPAIRQQVDRDMSLPGMPRERVLAAVVKLLETTLIRVGNEEYARTNHSYGLTTLNNRHVEIHGTRLCFHFRGKSGIEHDISVRDPRTAKIVKRCIEIPGRELFQYLDENGDHHKLTSGDVNEYLKSICESDFTAKDYRTWAGSVLALQSLMALPPEFAIAARKKNVVTVVADVAQRLGNTPAVCRRCYIHPNILNAYVDGRMPDVATAKGRAELSFAETRLLRFLENFDRLEAVPAAA